MRGTLRDHAVDFAAGLLAAFRGTSRHRGDALVLAYHNIVPDELAPCGDRSLHLPIGRFRAQLDALQRSFDIVSLDAALLAGEPAARPRIALTFDDAYLGAVTLGFGELAARALPATVFIAPGLLGHRTTWWDALADLWRDDASAALRDACLATGARLDAVQALAASRGLRWTESPEALAIADAAQLQASRFPGLTVGAHTWHHVNLRRWQSDWAEQELIAPLAWIQSNFADAARPWLALPFGLESDAALAAAAAHGYTHQFFVAGGWRNGAAVGGHEPRLNVPAGATPARLLLRIGTPDGGLRLP